MTAYELRKHLAQAHHLPLSGLAWAVLCQIHDQDHEAVQGHHHEDEVAG